MATNLKVAFIIFNKWSKMLPKDKMMKGASPMKFNQGTNARKLKINHYIKNNKLKNKIDLRITINEQQLNNNK